ncbi:zinc-ribbon and DUF3426 domain-containing protein [Usitatibacter palustris]|uniref:Zinc finger/thioredoxin putative domain-containing protein n=1 Tax=Usitatibacter palustris TaxID=2732487 RepID=A0A6M4HDT9_9PROT|nr:zinc-ribbon and DUF3426 domain-containing protein [Usitatibacter palustris]QJR16908.1 hypothetical protein DSM104440_03744 [Usitatibacter palustris]
MLITTCTHCLARFRVTPQQLNLRQGQVRCGSCQTVFSGFEALERFPDDDTGTRILAARAAAAAGGAHGEALPSGAAPIADLPDEGVPEVADEVARTPAAAAEPAAERPRVQPPVSPLIFEEPAPPPRPSRAWVFGCALMAVLLVVQLAYAFRSELAQAYPVSRPFLESVCASAGCSVPWVNDAARLKLEDSELLEVPGRPQEIALGARIRNLAPVSQEFPHIELTLTDLSGQAAARRILRPVDYLGRAPAPSEAMSAGSELAIQLRLETPRIKATGYELQLFYP